MVGILNLHKPPNLTSRAAVDIISRLAKTKRAGHAGTLDPMASGVLLVCVGWATRLVSYLQDLPKSYSARFLLGRRSDTDDVTGNVIETTHLVVPEREQVEQALKSFFGRIMQVPPQFSAVHVGGKRAYAAARKGLRVEIEPRPVEVFNICLRDYAYPELSVDIDCGSGTYIRSIGRDLGELLQCGAVMSALSRTAIGEFTLDTATTIEELEADWQILPSRILAPLSGVPLLSRFSANADECTALLQGKALFLERPDWGIGDEIAVVDPASDLFALAEYVAGPTRLKPRHVFGGARNSPDS